MTGMRSTNRRQIPLIQVSIFTAASILLLSLSVLQLQGAPKLVSSFAPSSTFNRRPAFLSTKDAPRIIQEQAFTLRKSHRVLFGGQALAAATADDYNDDDDDDDDILDPVELPQGMEDGYSNEDLQDLTVPQLKQQLRLRGLKVSGRKQDLIARLLPRTTTTSPSFASSSSSADGGENSNKDPSKAQAFAAEKGKELIDVTEYLDEEDIGKNVRTWKGSNNNQKKDVVDAEFEKAGKDDESSTSSSGDGKTEVWGSEARIVDDYEGRKVVVDCLSQTVVEFKGSNQSYVSASVVASRDALKPFLAGGGGNNDNNRTQTSAEERVREIQSKRETASRMPVRFEDDTGLDEGDETGLYANVVERDYSDWGKFTLTGAQISSSEVQGVLLLSDVYGAFSPDIQTLAEKIAFECQPVVVMVPDLFRGNPWKEDPTSPGQNQKGQTFEEWRATHSDLRVSVDIRAAAACLRERYGVSSVAVWGTCYGGGRALEAAAGYLPDGIVHDIDGSIGPPPVNPMATVAWYPTRYNATALFGKDRVVGIRTEAQEKQQPEQQQFAVMGVFAGNDNIPGATPEDAAILKAALGQDNRVKDHLVKVFPDQDHGFAHIGLAAKANMDSDTAFERFVDDEFGGAGQVSLDDGEADVACLLSTAFFETYSRVFLPTTGAPIYEDRDEWSSELNMKTLSDANTRDIRQEIEDSLENYVEPELGGRHIDPTDETQRQEMEEMLRSAQTDEQKKGPFRIEDGDDWHTMFGKLKMGDESFEIF